jgi:uncharacterized membrane protein (Fun14 family)
MYVQGDAIAEFGTELEGSGSTGDAIYAYYLIAHVLLLLLGAQALEVATLGQQGVLECQKESL